MIYLQSPPYEYIAIEAIFYIVSYIFFSKYFSYKTQLEWVFIYIYHLILFIPFLSILGYGIFLGYFDEWLLAFLFYTPYILGINILISIAFYAIWKLEHRKK